MFVMSRHVVSMNGTSSTGLCIDDTVDYSTDINQINLFQGKQVWLKIKLRFDCAWGYLMWN